MEAPQAKAKRKRNRKNKGKKASNVAAVQKSWASLVPSAAEPSFPNAVAKTRANVKSLNQLVQTNPFASRQLQQMMKKFLSAGLEPTDTLGEPTMPRLAGIGSLDFVESVARGTVVIDIVPVIALLNSTNANVPVMSPNVKVWGEGSFPIVAFHDAYAVAALPCLPTANRLWAFWSRAFENGTFLGKTGMSINESLDLGPENSNQMPTGMAYRPVTTRVSANEHYSYIWIDANAGLGPATLSFTSRGNIATGSVNLTMSVLHYENDCEDSIIDQVQLSPVSGLFNLPFPSTIIMKYSGYYRFLLTVHGNTSITTIDFIDTTIGIYETTAVATAFIVNQTHVSANQISRRHWLAGSGLLISARFPLLTTEGSIVGCMLDPTYQHWYAATSDGVDIVNRLPPEKVFGAAGGGVKLSQGAWMFGSPSEFPSCLTSNGVTNDSLAGTSTFGSGDNLPIAHLLPSDDSDRMSVGMKVAFLTVSTGATSASMRLSYSRIIDYTTDTQLIQGRIPQFISIDQWGAATCTLARFPPMTSNDWHSFLNSVAATAGKFAGFLVKASEGVGKFVPFAAAGARLAAELAVL